MASNSICQLTFCSPPLSDVESLQVQNARTSLAVLLNKRLALGISVLPAILGSKVCKDSDNVRRVGVDLDNFRVDGTVNPGQHVAFR